MVERPSSEADGEGTPPPERAPDSGAEPPRASVREVSPPSEPVPGNGSGPPAARRVDLVGDLHTLERTAKHARRSKRLELVNFRHVVQAWLWSRCNDDDSVRNQAGKVLPDLVDAFSEQNGGIHKMSFYEQTGAGVALTNLGRAARKRRPALHVEAVASERRDPRARHLIMKALDLHNRALQHLPAAPRRIVVMRLHGILEALLSQLEGARVADEKLTKEDYISLQKELAIAARYYDESVQRGAQLTYFGGTLFALLPFILAALYLIVLNRGSLDLKLSDDELLLSASALSGAGGAAVSVMTRLAGGKLQLTGLDEANRPTLFVFGGIRTFIGAAFGSLVFLFIFSTVLDIRVPDKPFDTRLYFLIVLGFIAGFSERFAQDALAGAEVSISPATGAPQTARPATSRARQGRE